MNLVFKNKQAPGDVLVMTNLIRDIKLLFKEISIDVRCYYPEVLENNPNITSLDPDIPDIELSYKEEMLQSHITKLHFSDGYFSSFYRKTGLEVPKTSMYPDLFLTEEEKDRDLVLKKFGITGEYWLANCGFKIDMPLKAYPPKYWKEVIFSLTKDNVQIIQVGSDRHIHPEFGIQNLIGKTENLRDYFSLCYHSSGHLCHITLAMHVMAAFRKPCVIFAGGRETSNWEIYPDQLFLHSTLSCCVEGGCWKKQRQECNDISETLNYPNCMGILTPDFCLENIRYYMRGLSWI